MLRHCSSDVEVLFIRCRGTVRLDTVHPTLIDTVYPTSIDTVHFPSIDIVHPATVHRILFIRALLIITLFIPDTVHPDTVHPVKNDTTCRETEKIEVLILKVDENEMLRDEEGRIRNSAGQFINAQGAVIPDVIVVAEMNNFDLSREWYDWVGQDPFQGLPHQDPRNHIEELEDLVSRGEHNEVFEYHMLCKIFPYSISGNAFSWFSQLQPGSLTSWDDIEKAFLYKFLGDAEATGEKEKNDKWDRFLASLDEEYMIPIQLLDDIMPKADEQHVFGELSRVEESTSTSNDTSTSTSIDGTISTSTDDKISTSIDITTSSSIDSGRVSEQKEFDVCENLRDGDTTRRSDKSGGKKRRNWKKRKRIKDGPQVKLALLFMLRIERECPSVLLEDKQKEFELVFQQCHRFEFNQHPVAEVMLVLLKSSQSASREEAVEEMKDCRSM
uniref:Retrotransposon gag domain-containing protein n=1 Tax=Brassica oleracea var. oleracea TaxID=109376 RepID=A0A0D3DLE2_BRAOL